ncbi:hypothetical protein HHI36_003648 [Cryptolaemus montrouzieri]|uniref:Uncharacterized protein n=1 Tax=Cryptolaemus montrouzieri TaxID=559131 RepID=A0ABD2PEA0_9CUCU
MALETALRQSRGPFSYEQTFFPTMPLTLRLQHLLLVTILSVATGADLFSNSFLVKFKRDVNHKEAHEVAKRLGFVNMGPMSIFAPRIEGLIGPQVEHERHG